MRRRVGHLIVRVLSTSTGTAKTRLRATAAIVGVLALGSLAACSGTKADGARNDPGWANCIAQGHNADHCDSKFPAR